MGKFKITMFGLWLTLTLMVALGSSVLKNRVQVLERKLATINSNIQNDIAQIHVLKAEWSHYNTPDRLRKLASEQLSLENAKPEQIINYSALHFNYEDENQLPKAVANKKELTTLVKATAKSN